MLYQRPSQAAQTEDRQPQKSQKTLDFGEQVRYTSRFLRTWKTLPHQQQRCAEQKIRFLVANPRHPSLRIHQHHRSKGTTWECSVSLTTRILFQYRKGGGVFLCDVGGHAILDRAHQRNFAEGTRGEN